MDGIGTIAVSGGQASFDFHVTHSRRFPRQIIGYCAFNDPAGGIGFGNRKVTSLRTNGNHAHFTGTVRIGRRMRVFTVDVDDCPDTFTIRIGSIYSAGGSLTSGDIIVHR